MQSGDGYVSRDLLQRRDEKGSARHQEKQEQAGSEQSPHEMRAKCHQKKDLEHRHQAQLPAFLDVENRSNEPNTRKQRHQHYWPQSGTRRNRHNYCSPLPEQKANQRENKKTMIISSRLDPYSDRSAYLTLKNDSEDQAGDADQNQRWPPPGRDRQRGD